MLKFLLICFVLCFILERMIPGWKLPSVRTWPLRVVAVNFVQLGVVTLAGLTWERELSIVGTRTTTEISPGGT